MSKLIHKDLTFKINGACFKVHNKLDRFLKEKQYSDELERELKLTGLDFEREFDLKKFDPEYPNGNRVDYLIEKTVILDVKAKRFITKQDYYQMRRYLTCAGLELGLIVNFRDSYLRPKRVLNGSLLF